MLNPHDRRPIVAHWSGDRKKRMVPTGSAPVGGTGHPSIPAQDTPSMSSRSAVGARGVVRAARLALPGALLFGGNHRGVGLGGWEAAGAAAGGCPIGQQGTERSSWRRQSLSSGEREHALDGALLSMTGPERALRLVPPAPGVLPPATGLLGGTLIAAERAGTQSVAADGGTPDGTNLVPAAQLDALVTRVGGAWLVDPLRAGRPVTLPQLISARRRSANGARAFLPIRLNRGSWGRTPVVRRGSVPAGAEGGRTPPVPFATSFGISVAKKCGGCHPVRVVTGGGLVGGRGAREETRMSDRDTLGGLGTPLGSFGSPARVELEPTRSGSSQSAGSGLMGGQGQGESQGQGAGSAMDQAKQQAGQAVDTAKEKAGQVAEQASTAADTGLDKAAGGLDKAADLLRQRSEGMGGQGGGMQSALSMAAGRLDQAAQYLKDKDSQQLMTDLEGMVRQKPTQTLLIAAGVGFLLSKVVR